MASDAPSPQARHPSRPRGSRRAAERGHYREGGGGQRDLRERGRRDGGQEGAPGAARGAGGVRGQARGGARCWIERARDGEREQGMRSPWESISPGPLRPAPLRAGAARSTPRCV